MNLTLLENTGKCIYFVLLLFSSLAATSQHISDVRNLEIEDGLLARVVHKVVRDQNGFFYLFFEDGIQRYDGVAFHTFKLEANNIQDLMDVKILNVDENENIYFKSDHRFFKITKDKVVEVEDQASLKFRTLSNEITIDEKSGFRTIDGEILAGEGSFWNLQANQTVNLHKEEAPNLDCHILTQDVEGNLIALYGDNYKTIEKILVYGVDGVVQDYSFILKYNNNILDVYVDKVNGKWMLATFNGIYIITFAKAGIKNYEVKENVRKSDFGNIITGVASFKDEVYFVNESYGLFMVNGSGQVSQKFQNIPEHFHQNRKLIADPLNDQMYSYSSQTNADYELLDFDPMEESLLIHKIPCAISDIYNASKNELLIGGHDYKNHRYDDTERSGILLKFNKIEHQTEVLVKGIPKIRTIDYNPKSKEYWIGTDHGIFIYDQEFSLIDQLTKSASQKSKVLKFPFIITQLFYDDYVLAGSYGGGIYVIDQQKKEVVKVISEKDGLSDDLIVGLIADDEYNVWVSTFNGINILDESLSIIKKIFDYEGLPNREFNSKAVTKDAFGNLWWGSLNGVSRINPKTIIESSESFVMSLDHIYQFQNGSRTEVFLQDSTLQIYSNIDSLQLKFKFADFYHHRFSDFDRWINVSGLESGPHDLNDHIYSLNQFEIGVDTIQFHQNNSGNSLRVELEVGRDNRNLRKGIFIILFASLIGSALGRWRFKEMEKKQKEKTKINTRIAELELTALRSQMNPHFIFNALGSIQYFIQTQETEKADNYLSDFAMLMRKILESSKSKFITLKEEAELLRLYVGLEKIRFEEVFDYTLTIDPEIELDNPVPPMVIQPFVENAINHGIFNLKDRKGELNIYFKYLSDQKIQCVIEDNGIGRDASQRLKKSNHKSRGMEIVNERVNTINQLSEVKVSMEIEDKVKEGKPLGTKVIILFEYSE